MKARRYETIFIIVPDLKEEEYVSIRKWARNIVKNNSGLVASIEDWGKKKLAYPIRKKQKGLYILLNYFGSEKVVSELERNMRIKEEILRFLTIKLEEETEVDETTFEEPAEEEAVEEEAVEAKGEETAADKEEMIAESPKEEVLEAGEGEAEAVEAPPAGDDGGEEAGSIEEETVVETVEETVEGSDAEIIAAEEPLRAEDVGGGEEAADKSDLEDEPLAPDEAMEEEGPKDHLDEKA